VLAWRKSFTRLPAVEAVRRAVIESELPGVRMLDEAAKPQ
jgi:LysR family transcriptional regulator, hydrogen peroxide-inducible genes activator